MVKKTIIVAGGSSGIGYELSKKLLNHDYYVVNLDLYPNQLIDDEKYLSTPIDLKDCKKLKEYIKKLNGNNYSIEGLAIVAGRGFTTPFEELDEIAFTEQVENNLHVVFNTCSAVIPYLTSPASIVTVGSTSVYGFSGSSVAYAAAKAGVIGLTKSLAKELGSKNIRVNCVVPGAVDTPLLKRLSTNTERTTLAKFSSLGNIAKPEEVAETLYFLLGKESSHVTGQTLVVDGGLSLAYRPAYM